MQIGALDRDTLLDLTVNAVPLGILAFFFVLFIVSNPFGLQQPVYVYLQFGIVGLSFVFLTILSYLAGEAVVKDERSREEAESHGAAEDGE